MVSPLKPSKCQHLYCEHLRYLRGSCDHSGSFWEFRQGNGGAAGTALVPQENRTTTQRQAKAASMNGYLLAQTLSAWSCGVVRAVQLPDV